MIEKPEATAQVRRLAGLDHFPADAKAVEELISAMRNFDIAQAKAFVDDWLSRNTEAPKPVHIRRAALGETEWKKPEWEKPKLCPDCESWGHVVRDGVHVRCSCENGQALLEAMLDMLNRPRLAARPGERVKRLVRADEILTSLEGLRR